MKINKILSSLAAGLMLVAAGACTDEVKYEPAPSYSGDEVYFNLDEIGQLDIEEGATSISFNLYRVDGSGEITVGIESTVTDTDGNSVDEIFDVPSSVTFPAGATKVEVPVGVVFSAVTAEEPYTMFVKVAGETQTPYGATEGSYTLLYGTKYEPWHEYLEGENAWFQMAGAWDYLYDAPLYERKSTNMPALTQYRIEDPFSDADWNYIMTVHSDIVLTDVDPEEEVYLVTMDPIDTGVEFKESTLYMMDSYSFIENFIQSSDVDRVLRVLALNNIVAPYYKKSTGQIFLNILACESASAKPGNGNSYPSLSGVQIIQFPGFKSYGVYIFDGGVSIDGTGAEEKQFDIYKTVDTPGMVYTMRRGTLTDAEILAAEEELLANDEIEPITEGEATVKFSLTEGDYTLILVGVDETGKKVCHAVEKFTYQPTVDDGFKTIGYAEYTDGFVCSLMDVSPMTWSVEVQQSKENPDIYRLKNPYRYWAEANEMPEMAMRGNYYITLNTENKTLVYITEGCIGLRNDIAEGAVYAYSRAAQMLAEGATAGKIKLAKANGSMKGNVITFPVNSLLVAYQSELPTYRQANTRSSFKLDLNTLTTTDNKPVRGRVVSVEEKTEMRGVSRTAVMM